MNLVKSQMISINFSKYKRKKDKRRLRERERERERGGGKKYIKSETLEIELSNYGSKLKYTSSSSSSPSCRAALTDIPDPLSPLLHIVHRLWQIFKDTSCILALLLNVCLSWSSCFCPAICGGP